MKESRVQKLQISPNPPYQGSLDSQISRKASKTIKNYQKPSKTIKNHENPLENQEIQGNRVISRVQKLHIQGIRALRSLQNQANPLKIKEIKPYQGSLGSQISLQIKENQGNRLQNEGIQGPETPYLSKASISSVPKLSDLSKTIKNHENPLEIKEIDSKSKVPGSRSSRSLQILHIQGP